MRIWRVEKLAELLAVTEAEVTTAAERFDDYCVKYRLVTPKKERIVLGTEGLLRKVQDRLFKRVLSHILTPSEFSHGGIPGRSIKTNGWAHSKARFIYKADVTDFYPSISHNRVFRFFRSLEWPEEVSRICTRLSTSDYHLALGLVTSPIIADQIFKPIDSRIAGVCKAEGLVYTRYVDDITISASYDLDPEHCGVAKLIDRILGEHGFSARRDKELYGRADDPKLSITGVRLKRGNLSATPDFCASVDAALDVAEALQADKYVDGEFYPQRQVRGKIYFVRWVNRGRAVPLMYRFRKIDWNVATSRAIGRGILAEKPRLIRV